MSPATALDATTNAAAVADEARTGASFLTAGSPALFFDGAHVHDVMVLVATGDQFIVDHDGDMIAFDSDGERIGRGDGHLTPVTPETQIDRVRVDLTRTRDILTLTMGDEETLEQLNDALARLADVRRSACEI